MRNAPDIDAEVIVVGARCAGAATAMLLARQGREVLIVDRAAFPSDTLSTHAIARGGVVQLARWGLLDEVVASGAPPIRRVTFQIGQDPVLHKEVKESAGVDHLIAPRRHVLDTILLNAAVDAGARFESGVTVSDVLRDETGRVVGVTARDAEGRVREIRARFVVGADGVRSRIARAVGAGMIDERPSNAATHYAYVSGLDADGFEFHVGDNAFSGVFPTNDDEANVWICHPADTGGIGGTGLGGRGDGDADRARARVPSSTCWRRRRHRSHAGSRTPASRRSCVLRCASPTMCARRQEPGGPWSATPATTATPSPATESPMRSATPSCSRGTWNGRWPMRWLRTRR